MKVLFYPDRARTNPYQRMLADSLARRNVEVQLATTSGPLHLRQALKKTGPVDVVHVHWPEALMASPSAVITWARSIIALAEVAYLKRRGVKIVWTVHNLVSHRLRFASTEVWALRRLAKMADAIIVHFPDAAPLVRDRYQLPDESRITAIPHGNYLGRYENRVSRQEARQRLGLNAGDRALLFFGVIRPYKGLVDLLEAFANLPEPNARLIIAGNISHPEAQGMRETLDAAASRDKRIHTHFGYVPDDEIQIYMNAADAVVLPFDDTFTSGSAVLAMGFGKAIVTPDLPHLRYLLEDSGGILYPRGEKGGLKQALEGTLVADLRAKGARNLKVAESYSWDRIAEQTEGVYLRALG